MQIFIARNSATSGLLGPSYMNDPSYRAPKQVCEPFGRIDLIGDSLPRLRFRALLDLRRAESGSPHMCKIESLVEAYLIAERTLVEAVDAAGGKVPLPDGRTVTVGRAEFDALPSGRCKRAWVTVRRCVPMPPRR
jgi:hypothetical protein